MIPTPENRPLLVVQVTDTHLVGQRHHVLRGIPPYAALQSVLRTVTTLQPDIILLTGDIAEAGEAAAYAQLVELVTPLGIPTLWCPGNHDNADLLARILRDPPFSASKALQLGGWQLLLLDSVLVNSRYGEGFISSHTFDWLTTHLQQSSGIPTLVALHHHPIPVGIDWLDQMPVLNGTVLLECLRHFPQVQLVVFGHIHRAFVGNYHGIPCYGTPSSHTQVTITTDNPEAYHSGLRLLWLYPDGRHETKVYRDQQRVEYLHFA